jgi:hypothetical protein
MAISNDILSSTLRILLDEEVDNLYKAVPLLDRMREQGGVETYDGGQKLSVPLILEEHSSITQLSSGYEPVNLAVKDALRTADYEWCDFVAPIVITRKEELSNKGERAIINIAEARMKSVMGLLKREVEKQLVANSSTVLTELNTFNGITGGAGSATGFFENAAFGAQTNVVGGIDKAVFTTYNNQFIDFGGNLATNMISNLTDLYVQCQINTPDGSSALLISSATTRTLCLLKSSMLITNQKSTVDDWLLALLALCSMLILSFLLTVMELVLMIFTHTC